jgi:hypothetical protein
VAGLLSPILFGLAPHRFTRRVLHLEPVRRAPRPIRRILQLRDDALEPKFAGVKEDHLAVVEFQMLVETDPGPGLSQDGYERGLARLERLAAQVIARLGRRHRGTPSVRSVGGEVSWSQRSTLKVK